MLDLHRTGTYGELDLNGASPLEFSWSLVRHAQNGSKAACFAPCHEQFRSDLKQPNEGIQPSTTLQEVEKPSNITHLEPLKLHRSKCQNDIIEPESR